MTMFVEQGCFRSRSGRATALSLMAVAGCLAFGLGSSPAEAQYRSNSGIVINTDVLDSLGPGPAPMAPLPLAPPPLAPPPLAAPGGAAAAPLPQFNIAPSNIGAGNTGGATQQRGDGAIVVTRPGTLLFPPLRDPSSSLTPGFSRDVAQEQRKQAFDNAFADGPEPQSQLLLPLANAGSGAPAAPLADEGEWVFQTVIIESKPIPQPSPRKPAPSPAMMAALEAAEQEEPGLQEAVEQGLPPVAVTTVELPADGLLAPEFRDEPASNIAVAANEEAGEAPGATLVAEAENMAASEAVAETAIEATEVSVALPAAEMPATPEASLEPAPLESAPLENAEAIADPVENAERPVADASAPVSLLPQNQPMQDQGAISGETAEAAAGDSAESTEELQQVASLSDAAATPLVAEDISFVFDTDSAELTTTAQATLRSLAEDLRGKGGDRIQVLGFASSAEGSPDLARQLALSRALKVRTFLIDAGIPSARIQVRPPSNASGSGPANRVDIKPVGS